MMSRVCWSSGHAVRADEGSGRRIVLVIAAGLAEKRDFPVRGPFMDRIAGNIAEQQIAFLLEPDGSFGEGEASRQLFDFRFGRHDGVERRVHPVDRSCLRRWSCGHDSSSVIVIFYRSAIFAALNAC